VYTSVTEIAEAEVTSESYISRIVPLAQPAPEIVENDPEEHNAASADAGEA
jgi:hypothetical protein